MIVSRIRDRVVAAGRELSARVTFEDAEPETHRIWIRRPDPGDEPPGRADPLFANLLISAMALHEDLVVEGPVSAALVEAATQRVVPQLLAWHPRLRACRVEVASAEQDLPAPPEAGTGCLFSGGVDSWHTFLRRRDEVSDLVHVWGFEIDPSHEALWSRAHANVQRIAEERGVGLLAPRTNFLQVGLLAVTRRLARLGRPWRDLGTDAWYGSMLVAVGLALRPRLGRLLVPGSWSQAVDYPVASHPLMEPAWSIDSMAFELDGFESSRTEKVRRLVRSAPEAVPELRVCIDTSGRAYERLNCGRCVKCVRLMMELRVCGVRDVDDLFAHRVDLRRAMRRRFHADPAIWGDLEAEADAAGEREIRDAIRVMCDRKLYVPRMWRDLWRALRKRSWDELRWPRRRRD